MHKNQIKRIIFNIVVSIAMLFTINGAYAQAPTITSFAPNYVSVGTSVFIYGTNFNTIFSNNIVFFGATQATVSFSSATLLIATVPTGASYQSISVTDITTGLTAYSAYPFSTEFVCGGAINTTSFAPKVNFTTGPYPFCVLTSDIDGDGKTDLAVTDINSFTVSVFRNTSSSGTISFAPKVDFITGTSPYSLSISDFDGDGKKDLAVTNYTNSGFVSVFRNTGSIGTISFAAKVDFTTGIFPYGVSTGDFDGDGKTDLAVANNNSISVFRNTGNSGTISFAPKVDLAAGSSTISITSGDFDGDGKRDLAVGSFYSLSVFRNTGSSGIISFAPKVDFVAAGTIYSITTGDFDRDGKQDFVVANRDSSSISVFQNTGSSGIISFAPKVNFTTQVTPQSVSTSDLNGDGMPDLVVGYGNLNSAIVSVFQNTSNNGIISFAAKVDFITSKRSQSVTTGDFDGDGRTDLAFLYEALYVLKNQIYVGPPVTANASATTVCAGTSVTLTGGGADIYTWTGGVTNGVGFIPPIGTTTYTVTGTVTATGCLNTATKTITVKPLPIVTANATSTTVCAGVGITLTGGGTANTYAWSGGVSNGVSFVPPTGTTTYTVTGTDLNGCSNTANITINVITTLPTVTANATATTVCAGTRITVTGGGANTYTWTGGVTNGVSFVPPIGTNTYTVTGTVTATGCQNTATITITVNPLPSVTANASASAVCEGTSITLTGGGANTYAWSGGVTNGVAFIPPLGTTTYTVTGTELNGCSNTATKTIKVNPILKLTSSSIPTSKCSGPCNGVATITNVSGGQAPYTYQWDANANNQTTQTASSLCQGYYSVTVTDVNGCSVTENVLIEVSTLSDANVYLTNLAAIDQVTISPAFAAFYTYNLPPTITPNSTNPRNFVDPGKKARFKVECTNQKGNGQSIVSGICKVRSNNPYITITDSSSALNNIGWNNKAWSADEFEIDIAPNTPPGTNVYIDFIVQENGQDFITTCISIPIRPLVYSPTSASTIDDDSNPDSRGNNNDVCEDGEIIEFYPWLDNISTLNAEFVRGRFENLDNLNYVTIWDGVQGTNTTVYNAGWWNYAFAQPAIINANSLNTTPEYDFVFNYNNTNIINNFKLYMVMAGGFKLFSGNALSLVQWSLPYTFRASGSVSIATESDTKDLFNVYPNPTNELIRIDNKNEHIASPYVIFNSIGMQVVTGKLLGATTTVDMKHLPSGIYLLQVGEREKRTFKLIKN